MPIDQPQEETTYFIDAENAAEMARLMHQDRILTKGMGGLFPEQFDLSNVHDILDIGCGPGGWVLDVAHTYPEISVTGVDISRLMVEYARAQARVQWSENANFRVMDAMKPLDFEDNSFDLVNIRFISGFMPKTLWPQMLQECMRILRPGRIVRVTEPEYPISNSPALEKLGGMVTHAVQLAGQSFSPDGRHAGITPMLGRLLRNAGFVDVQKKAYVLDCSAGMEAHESQYQNTMVFLKLIEPFLIKMNVATAAEVNVLYEQALREMLSDDFCAVWYYLSVWGKKTGGPL